LFDVCVCVFFGKKKEREKKASKDERKEKKCFDVLTKRKKEKTSVLKTYGLRHPTTGIIIKMVD